MKTKIKFIDLGTHYKSIRGEILEKFDEISSRGDYILTEELEKFEKNISNYCGTKYAAGVGNCTDALFLSLKALGIGSGDEVITAPNSFIATAGAIVASGARPVFADVRNDYNIDPEIIEKTITKKTKAIIPVHLTGRSADMTKIMEIAQKRGLAVIEDAAQSIGAGYKNKRVGSFGIAGCFSLHPLKNLHAHGDGGLITTSDDAFYEKLLKLRNHGLKNRDECELWGYNSRLDAIQAAIGNIKMKYIDKWAQRRREIASMYKESLAEFAEMPEDKEYEEPVYHTFVIQSDNRDELRRYLAERGIETKIHYPIPIHLQQPAKALGYKKGDFPAAEAQAKKILSLPIYPELSNKQVEEVINGVKSFYIGTHRNNSLF